MPASLVLTLEVVRTAERLKKVVKLHWSRLRKCEDFWKVHSSCGTPVCRGYGTESGTDYWTVPNSWSSWDVQGYVIQRTAARVSVGSPTRWRCRFQGCAHSRCAGSDVDFESAVSFVIDAGQSSVQLHKTGVLKSGPHSMACSWSGHLCGATHRKVKTSWGSSCGDGS